MKQRLLSVTLSLVLSAFLALPVVAQTNAAIVKLETGDKTITVGDSPVMFYDDGGADGDIAKDASRNGDVHSAESQQEDHDRFHHDVAGNGFHIRTNRLCI